MSAKPRRLAIALTWDGVRWPVRSLPSTARDFLKGQTPASSQLARLFAEDDVKEIRICWVPRLKGGANVLCPAFSTKTGRRIAFQPVQWRRWGDVLGVVYRRGV